jgi:hypothetical protein
MQRHQAHVQQDPIDESLSHTKHRDRLRLLHNAPITFCLAIIAAVLALNALILFLTACTAPPGKESPHSAAQERAPVCSTEGAHRRPTCGPGNGVFDCLPTVRDTVPVPRRALATFLQNDKFLAGALALAYSLRRHGNSLPMILYTIEGLGQLSPAARRAVECAGWQIREWKNIKPYQAPAMQFVHLYAVQAPAVQIVHLCAVPVLHLRSMAIVLAEHTTAANQNALCS